jgi:uncharacterized RDD family membrane protein YckC
MARTRKNSTMSKHRAKIARLPQRWIASSIDYATVFGIFVTAQVTAASIGGVLGKAVSVSGWAAVLMYEIACIGWWGQTFGLWLLKLKIVTERFKPVGFYESGVRFGFSVISLCVLGLGYLWAIVDSKSQTWHDKVAGTVVISLEGSKR